VVDTPNVTKIENRQMANGKSALDNNGTQHFCKTGPIGVAPPHFIVGQGLSVHDTITQQDVEDK